MLMTLAPVKFKAEGAEQKRLEACFTAGYLALLVDLIPQRVASLSEKTSKLFGEVGRDGRMAVQREGITLMPATSA